MASDIFLKLDGIKGESLDKAHLGEIECLSLSWGMALEGSTGGAGGSSRTSVHDISITKITDSASPQLMKSSLNGNTIPSGIIAIRKAGQQSLEYFKMTLTNVLVSSLQMSGNHSGTPTETVTLNFAKVVIAISPMLATGGLGTAQLVTLTNSEFGQFTAPPP